jgi:SAM-dependent methyltransferase
VDTIGQMREDWEQRARQDPFYYVAFAERGQTREAFLATAAKSIHCFEAELVRLAVVNPRSRRALEIGCGPGRLMLPMSRHFGEIHGVDISPEMIRLAQETLRGVPGVHLHVAPESDLRMFNSGTFDFVYSFAVFQHIPSRAIVLNYLRDIARVLKPGGISLFQLRGAPPLASQIASEPSTWTGCFFVWQDIRAFAEENRLQLVAISGLETQYTMLTFRKPDGSASERIAGPGRLRAVTPASGLGSTVPRSGRGSAICLWLEGLPADASLLDFQVDLGSQRGFPCYISPRVGESGYQLNVLLPPGLPTGQYQVHAVFRGTSFGNAHEIVVVEAPQLIPKLVGVGDGVNVGCSVIRSSALKVLVENIEDPRSISFRIGGKPPESVEFVCVEPITSQFDFALTFRQLAPGRQFVQWFQRDIELSPFAIEVELPAAARNHNSRT